LVRGGNESPISADTSCYALNVTCSQRVISGNVRPAGLLFEMSSIFHGQGIVICEGLVRGGSESPIPADMLLGLTAAAAADGSVAQPPPGMRVMRFWVKEGKSGSKLVSVVCCVAC
jgi:hypothetical protein